MELIDKINTLYAEVELKNKELAKLIDRSKENLAHLDKIKSDLDAREVSLNDRELKITKIENIVEAKKTAEKLLTEARDATNLLAEEKRKFDEYRAKEIADITQCKINTDSSIAEIKRREADVAAEKEILRREKLLYKTEIIRQMDKRG